MLTRHHPNLASIKPIYLLVFIFVSYMPPHLTTEFVVSEEICDNALDDDDDGMTDLNDPDCDCPTIEPISLIPNPSFEDMICCPSDRSELNCAEVWIQASEPTTDYIHTCNYLGWEEFPPPFPFPDGEGIMGFRDGRVRRNGEEPDRNWKEYAGACLLSPLLAGSTYLFEFHLGFVDAQKSPPINISFFGTTNCDNLPFGVGNEELGCPTNEPGWVKLGSKRVSGGAGNKWVKTTIKVTPTEDITAIAIGPDCPSVLSDISIYYFFDNLILADFQSFQFVVSEVNHPCSDDFSLQIPLEDNFFYQWYKDGIALIGETDTQLSQMYGEGNYQVRVLEDGKCKVTTTYNHTIDVFYENFNEVICDQETYEFGDRFLDESGSYVDTIKNENNCDVVVNLNLKVLGALADTVEAKIFEGERYKIGRSSFKEEGDYLVNLISSLGCDSLVLLRLSHYNIYIPNVFSPNNDSLNDEFTILEQNNLISKQHLIIYNRWGSIVHEGSKWNGLSKGKPVPSGVFLYVAKITLDDGIERQFSGSITVLR